MDTYGKIRQQIQEAFSAPQSTVLGVVKEVDTDRRTCTVDDEGALYYDVRLQCIAGGSVGIVAVPPAGAMVLMLRIENGGEWMITDSSGIESIRIDIGDKSVVMDKDGVVFNDGKIGLAKADNITDKLNALERQYNSLLSILSGITVPPQSGLVFAPLFSSLSPIAPTQRDEIEDSTVKH